MSRIPVHLADVELKIVHVWANLNTEAMSSDRRAGQPTFRRNVLLIMSEVVFILKMEAALHPDNEDSTFFPPKCWYPSTIVHGITSHKQQLYSWSLLRISKISHEYFCLLCPEKQVAGFCETVYTCLPSCILPQSRTL